jgi:hypothetical protein
MIQLPPDCGCVLDTPPIDPALDNRGDAQAYHALVMFGFFLR